MSSTIISRKRDLWGGAFIALCGALTILEASSYQVGELARMGPGYFPLLVGCFLVVLGLLVPLSPDPDEVQEDMIDEHLPQPSRNERIRGMACIAAGLAAFIVIGSLFGFLPATFALVFLSALGDTSNSVRSAAILALAMTVFGAVVFSWALQLQFPMFRWGW
ncbi:tripartite tricarboxylate transporter TctB family protein [Bordetella genomosp. 5]|uniref:tripartite tricarboxylate transporter TctB family protein n=1 Tax=Bordetella genomosp. 5 TaxID=1395608 RepID=UPI0020CE3583|nr:tripartite tricarboxylate transporter TctB family protein [Bordetella genomosp. 5]